MILYEIGDVIYHRTNPFDKIRKSTIIQVYTNIINKELIRVYTVLNTENNNVVYSTIQNIDFTKDSTEYDAIGKIEEIESQIRELEHNITNIKNKDLKC